MNTGSTKLYNVMHRRDAQVHGLGANEPTCTPTGDTTACGYNVMYMAPF